MDLISLQKKHMNKFIWITTLIVLVSCSNFDITSTSTCTNYTAGFCTRWEQIGTVQEQLGSCFPNDARVIARNGQILMRDLKRGDQILGWVDGKEEFVRVTSWLHREVNTVDHFLQLNTQAGWLHVSAKHNLATKQQEFKFAEDVDSLFPAGIVDSVSKVTNLGKYAPKTSSNNYFVLLQNSPSQGKALAHCFAHIRNPQIFEAPVAVIEALWDMFLGESDSEIHPSYIWLQQNLKILQE